MRSFSEPIEVEIAIKNALKQKFLYFSVAPLALVIDTRSSPNLNNKHKNRTTVYLPLSCLMQLFLESSSLNSKLCWRQRAS